MKDEMNLHPTKFSITAKESYPKILQGGTAQEFLDNLYQDGLRFGLRDIMQTGTYKIAGWRFDFREHLHKYIVGNGVSWELMYAPSPEHLSRVLLDEECTELIVVPFDRAITIRA